jgi:hypothetical protein
VVVCTTAQRRTHGKEQLSFGSRSLRIVAGDPPDSSTERIAPDNAASIMSIENLSGCNLIIWCGQKHCLD